MGFGFPKAKRLLKTKEFRGVFDVGTKSVTRHLVMFGVPSKTDRVGLVVSKKVGNAVTRNKVKRLLREQFRTTHHGSPFSIDLVVVARHTAKGASFEEIGRSLEKGISKIKKDLAKKSDSIREDALNIALASQKKSETKKETEES